MGGSNPKKGGNRSTDSFFLLFVILAILGVLGSVAWFVFFVWLAKKALSGAQCDLNRILPNLEQLIQSYSTLPPGQQMGQRM
jgi:flagellar basal body-associated protein FliL